VKKCNSRVVRLLRSFKSKAGESLANGSIRGHSLITRGTRLSMWTARPAARPPHPFLKLRAHPLDMLAPCLIFLDGDGPADPLVARERRYVFPHRPCLRVAGERFPEIAWEVMYDSSGYSNGCHSFRICVIRPSSPRNIREPCYCSGMPGMRSPSAVDQSCLPRLD
jgi:hypothetical protein